MSTCIISLSYARLSIGSFAYCILLPYFKNQNQKTLHFFSRNISFKYVTYSNTSNKRSFGRSCVRVIINKNSFGRLCVRAIINKRSFGRLCVCAIINKCSFGRSCVRAIINKRFCFVFCFADPVSVP